MAKTDNHKIVSELAKSWIQGLVLVAFEYAGGFRVRLEQPYAVTTNPSTLFPGVAILDLKASWWVNEQLFWKKFAYPPQTPPSDEVLEEAVQSYYLRTMIGAVVNRVQVNTNGNLELLFSGNQVLHIEGRTDVWDESWIISAPPDLLNSQSWSISCSSHSECLAIWPKEASE